MESLHVSRESLGFVRVRALVVALAVTLLAGSIALAGGTLVDFEDFDSGTCVDNLCEFDGIPGLRFTSPNVAVSGYDTIDVAGFTLCDPADCGQNVATGGGIQIELGSVTQTIELEFDPPVAFVALDLTDLDPSFPGDECGDAFGSATVRIFSNVPEQVPVTINVVGDGVATTPEHVEFQGDLLVQTVEITAGEICECAGEGQFCYPGGFGVDNIYFGDPPIGPPICARAFNFGFGISSTLDGLVIADPDGSGMDTVDLLTNASSLSLTTIPSDPFGAYFVDFTVAFDQTESQASGDVVATDLEGQSCSMGVDFTDDIPPGELIEEIICEDDGIQLFATNEDYPGGVIECSFTGLNELDPPLPPAYFPVEDCKVITVDSAISGETVITLKVEGTFDPDLRLLSSRFDGLDFGPWRDDTELVEEIVAIPDPTRMRGMSQWSIVKVTCAKLDIDCSDPSLDGLDQDGDGYVLCDGTTPVDCNDQRDVINPAADELCSNGLDDDCDGLLDDDDDGCIPLFVNVDSFTAELEAGGVRLRWTTSMELENLGFRVLRAGSGDKRVVLTPQLIPAAGTEGSGADYEFLDTGAPRRGVAIYYLEDVDLQGRVTRHGPVRVRLGGLKPRVAAGR